MIDINELAVAGQVFKNKGALYVLDDNGARVLKEWLGTGKENKRWLILCPLKGLPGCSYYVSATEVETALMMEARKNRAVEGGVIRADGFDYVLGINSSTAIRLALEMNEAGMPLPRLALSLPRECVEETRTVFLEEILEFM